MKSKGLGKGLNALLSEEALNINEEESVKTVNIHDIEPNFDQPRKNFTPEELNELSVSIQEHGILQPLIVRRKDDKYQIVAGERRYRAARLAKLSEIPIIIKSFDDQQTLEVSLIENIQREDLNSMELACGYQLLMDRFEYTQEQVADRVGKSRSAVANILRLLNLSPFVQQKVRDDELSYGHARALLGIKSSQKQREVAEYILSKQLSVRETEKLVQEINEPTKKKNTKGQKEVNPFYREIEEHLQKKFGTKVTISAGKKKGKIEIEYYSEEELERLLGYFNK